MMQEGAGNLNKEAVRLEELRSDLDRLIGNLSGETQLEAVRHDLMRQRAQMEVQGRALRRMSMVLTQVQNRYSRSENTIADRYEETAPVQYMSGYREYRVPDVYMSALRGV